MSAIRQTGKSALVRLRGPGDRAVKVRLCAVKSRAVSKRNCDAAMLGGEQRNENDQSVTQAVQKDRRGELDSVGVDGRAFERLAKPVKRAIGEELKRRTSGRTPDVAPMVGDGMAGSQPAIIRETRQGQAEFMAATPEEPPGGSQSIRSSEEAGNDRGAKGCRKGEGRRTDRRNHKPTRVPARASRWWHPPTALGVADTGRLTDGLGRGAKSPALPAENPP